MGPPCGRRRDARRPGLAPGHGPVPRRRPRGRRPGAGGGGRHRRADHRRAAPGGGRSWPAASASTCRCPPPSRRTTGRCSSTSRCPAGSSATSTAASATGATCSDVGRGLRAVAWERTAGQVVQAVADRRRPARAAVARAVVHAAGRGRARRGGRSASCSWPGRDRGGGRSRWARVRQRGGRRHPRRAARPPGVAGDRARVRAGRRRPRGHVPDRRADGGRRPRRCPGCCRWRCSRCWPWCCPASPAGGRARARRRGRSARPAWARTQGVATAVVYGVMVLVASLPGAAVLVLAWFRRRRHAERRSRGGSGRAQPDGAARCLTARTPC